MKFIIPTLTVGQMLRAQVQEIQFDRSIIVNFRGDLLRVVNDTKKRLEKGQWVVLKVTGTHPLKFQLQATDRRNFLSLKVEA